MLDNDKMEKVRWNSFEQGLKAAERMQKNKYKSMAQFWFMTAIALGYAVYVEHESSKRMVKSAYEHGVKDGKLEEKIED